MHRNNQWLDFCRALAIIQVVLSHGRILLIPIFGEAQRLKFGGFLGVELFFVLSGFLIGRGLLEQSEGNGRSRWWILRFWGRRWLRTYPNYLLFFCLNLGMISTVRPAPSPMVWRYLTFTQSLFSPHPAFYGEAWSLVIEEIFYFSIPLLIVFFRFCRLRGSVVLLASLGTLLLFSFGSRILVVLSNGNLTFNDIRSIALLRLDSIMVGVLISYWYYKNLQCRTRVLSLAPFGVLLLLPVICIASAPDSIIDGSRWLKVFLFPIANWSCAGLILLGLEWRLPGWLGMPSEKVARWSYAGYLVNLPILMVVLHFSPHSAGSLRWVEFVAGVVLVAAFVYHAFERPILRLRDKFIQT